VPALLTSILHLSPQVKLERQLPDGSTTTYIVLDNPSRLSRTEWARVVCVIVQGAAWQFKGWEWEQPVLLFQHVLGVHIKYDDVPMDTRVAGWNVRVLEVNKDKRHLDKVRMI
jgi:parafibromin